MRNFDPARLRERLDGHLGYKWSLVDRLEESRRLGGLSSTARSNINTAIQCILVGYDEAAEQLFKRALEWSILAIAENEKPDRFGPEVAKASRHFNLAMCNWLLNNIHDTDNFGWFVEFQDHALVGTEAGRSKQNISLMSIHYLAANAYRNASTLLVGAGIGAPASPISIQTEGDVFAGEAPRLVPGVLAAARDEEDIQEGLVAIQSEGQMCHVLCRHRLSDEYSGAQVGRAVRKFLSSNVRYWLSHGHFLRAAEWMKVIHWHDGLTEPSAKRAVLKCYDYLPNLRPPVENTRT